MNYSVFAGDGDIYVITSGGGVVCGDESALIRHMRHLERIGETETAVYIKRPRCATLEQVILTSKKAGMVRRSDRLTEIHTVDGVFVRLVAWNSRENDTEAVKT